MAKRCTDWCRFLRRYSLKIALCSAAALIAHFLWSESAPMPLFIGMLAGWWGGEFLPVTREEKDQ